MPGWWERKTKSVGVANFGLCGYPHRRAYLNHEVNYKIELAVCRAADRAQPEGMAIAKALGQGRTWHIQERKRPVWFSRGKSVRRSGADELEKVDRVQAGPCS